MLCAISNAVPADPVVSLKSGHVFERSLIEKYIDDTGKCPMSGEELSKDDLMPLKMGKPIKPRHSPAMSIPGILGMLHNEYDSVMLEVYELRSALRQARKELANSLYEHDAATRTIARLMSEKDAAEAALQDLKVQFETLRQQPAPAAADGAHAEGPQAKRPRPTEDEGLTAQDLADMEAKHASLTAGRKHRDPNLPGLAAVADIEALQAPLVHPLHSPSQPGIPILALQPTEPLEEPALIATGGADHTIQVFDTTSDVIAASLSGHSKKVTALTFAGASVLVSGAADHTVRMWQRSEDATWSQAFTETLPSTIVQLCTHPVDRFVVALCADASWKLLEVPSGRTAARSAEGGDLPSYTCGAMHPDGNFFAAAGSSGGVRLFDARNPGSPLPSIEAGVEGPVRSICFNENGYWAAISCDAGVQIWDLRNVSLAATLQPFDGAAAATVSWDFSGKYLACGGPGVVKVYEVIYKGKRKGVESHVIKTILDLPQKGVNTVGFGALARSLYVGTADHNLRVYKC